MCSLCPDSAPGRDLTPAAESVASLEELAALGFTCRYRIEPGASNAQRKRVRRRNAELSRIQRTLGSRPVGYPLRADRHQAATAPRTAPRPRGAGRPARRSAASSRTSSTDPGDSDEPEPPAGVVGGARGSAHRVALAWMVAGAHLLDEEQGR